MKDATMTVRIPSALKMALTDAAARDARTLSNLVALALASYVAQQQKAKSK